MSEKITIKSEMKKINKEDIPKNDILDFLIKNNITEISVENGLAFSNGKAIEIDGKPLEVKML